jgi:toxin ParE1/3/4
MEETKELQVRISKEFNLDLDDVYQYGVDTFGINQAERYENGIWQLIESLSYSYRLFPECRYLPTKSKRYRWIILDSHHIIYRISKDEVQVLRIIHSQRSISKTKSSRSVKL